MTKNFLYIMARKMEGMDKVDVESQDFKEVPPEEIELENLFDKAYSWEPFDGYAHNLFKPGKMNNTAYNKHVYSKKGRKAYYGYKESKTESCSGCVCTASRGKNCCS